MTAPSDKNLQDRTVLQTLTDAQTGLVTGGLNPQPLPPCAERVR